MPIKFRISWFWTLCITSLCVETTQLHSYVAHLVRVCTALQRTQVPFPGHMSGSSHWPVSPDPGDLMASTGTAFMCTPYMGLIIEWDLLCSDNKLQIPVLRYSKIIPYAHCGSRPRYPLTVLLHYPRHWQADDDQISGRRHQKNLRPEIKYLSSIVVHVIYAHDSWLQLVLTWVTAREASSVPQKDKRMKLTSALEIFATELFPGETQWQ